ncbi:MAG TPA: hypothetical protein VMR19_00635 [Candidatus Saccharimonadales bacterium]|jgi:hypothetical protein|nr:hypothetical protein [Candidatus Saccharimonadales bacterium]
MKEMLIGFDLYNLKGIDQDQEDTYQKLIETIRVKVENGVVLEKEETELLKMLDAVLVADAMASAGGCIKSAVITKKGLSIERVD